MEVRIGEKLAMDKGEQPKQLTSRMLVNVR